MEYYFGYYEDKESWENWEKLQEMYEYEASKKLPPPELEPILTDRPKKRP
jgi:hypothetical protein